MKYCRPATKDDFKGYDVQFDHHREMNNDVKILIEEGNISKANTEFRRQTGMGFAQMRPYIEEYSKYVQAKKDFEDGKPVFISY